MFAEYVVVDKKVNDKEAKKVTVVKTVSNLAVNEKGKFAISRKGISWSDVVKKRTKVPIKV